MPEVASQTLDFVGRELNVTLGEARTALENYVEQPDNVNLLERCTQELHQVQGVLRVLEIYGAALLAEEMEQVASYLLQTASERKSQAESLDALMRAMVQLPSYLERVLAGGRDLALVLLPLLNDLRAVRGSALLSEGTLLLLNLKSDKQAQPVAASPGEPPLTVEQWARRLRARFQVGLIGWIRGERVEQNLDILAAVAQKLEQIATRQPVFQLWWVTGAVIEALQENGLEGGVSIKRLLGLGDREIRRLYEQGEPRYAQTPAVELLNNLLYYVGRAESSGPRVMAVRASFRLSELLPVDESIEQERENLSAPSVKLMQTVAIAIREDLSKVKDVLDIFVRRGAGQPKELASQVEMLRKIGDTLGVLGLGELRGSVQVETERLEKIVDGTLPADEATLVQIAATLIGVEDRLDGQLVGLIRPKNATEPDEDEDNEFQQVQAAVLRECILNLARIKEAITQNVGGTLDAAGFDSWQELMRGLKAGLLMLGKARAVEVIEGVTGQLKRVMQPGGQGLPPGFMDRLADAIVSVEYYMETLQAGRSDPWYMLDNAQACVQALEHQQTPVLPTLPAVEPSAYARTLAISPSVVFGAEADPSSTLVGSSAPPPPTRSTIPPLAETADPELIKLFIEEAHEELAKIKKFFPAWDQNPMERDSLMTVRRSFHTLKGSGRMVGARELGEFAWSIENLLNRLLDNTLTRTPQIVEVLRDSVNALPELVEQLETGRAPRVDSASIAARAHAIAAGKPVPPPAASGATATVERTQIIPPPSQSSTATFIAPNVVQLPTPPTLSNGSVPTAPRGAVTAPANTAAPTQVVASASPRPTFAQSVTAAEPARATAEPARATSLPVAPTALARPGSTAYSAAAEHSLSDHNVGLAEQESAPSISRSFSSDPFAKGRDVPELSSAASDGSQLTADESVSSASDADVRNLAAGLDKLDLLLPEEPAAEEPIVLGGEDAPLAAGMGASNAMHGDPRREAPLEEARFVAETPAPPAQTGPDDVLRDIYTRETGTHVATVRAYLDREVGAPEPHAIPEDIYRACHTLSGSSKMAQVRHGIRLAEPLDHWLRRVFTSGLGLLNQDMDLLADCMVAMEAVVSHLDEVTGYFRNQFGLHERIAEAERVLDQRIAQAAEEQPEQTLVGEEDEFSADSADFDPEVAAIFTEEAMELIEFSESALSDWRSEPSSAEYRAALKRPLHTLKGGARMAGIMAMGDLSHELETLVMQVDNGSVPTDDAMFDVIQASLDELARMREAVANGGRVSSARAMIARIHSLTKPRGTAAPAQQPFIKAPIYTPQPAAPPAPQSYAPPSPALTPAEQEPPTVAASEPPAEAIVDSESAATGVAGFEPGVSSDAEPEASSVAELGASSVAEPEASSDAETQLNHALTPPHSSLPDTLIAPLSPVEFDAAGGSNPASADLTAELLASYPATSDQMDEDRAGEESADGESATYDLSGSDLADLDDPLSLAAGELGIPAGKLETPAGELEIPAGELETLAGELEVPAGEIETTAGELEIPGGELEIPGASDLAASHGSGHFAVEGSSDTDAARAAAADDHIATDYMAARDSAANEEVTPVESWNPESTQAHLVLNEALHADASADSPLLEDQPNGASTGDEQSAGDEPSVAGQWSADAGGSPSSTGQWAVPKYESALTGYDHSAPAHEQASTAHQASASSAHELPATAHHGSAPAHESPATAYDASVPTYGSAPAAYDPPAHAHEQPSTAYQQSAPGHESPATAYDASAPAYEQRPAGYDPAARAHESPTTAYDASARAHEQRPAAYDPSAPAHELPTTAYDASAPAYGQRPAGYDPLSRSYEQPSTAFDPSAPAHEPSTTAYDASARAHEQPPAAYDPSAPAYEQRPAGYDPLAPAHELPTTAYDASAPAYEQRPAGYDPLAPAHELPSTAYDASAPAYEQRPVGYDPSAPAHESPTTAYDPSARAHGQPSTVYDASAPAHESPATAYDASMPTYGSAPAAYDPSAPTHEQPSTAYDASAPAHESSTTAYDPSAPTYERRSTAYDASTPAHESPTGAYDPSAPTYEQPSTAYDASAPAHGSPTGAYDPSAPTYEQPSTAYDASAPAYEQRPVGYDPSAPAHESPTSAYDASVPTYEQPSTAYDASAPAHESPATAYDASAQAYGQPSTAYQPSAPDHESPTTEHDASGAAYEQPSTAYQPSTPAHESPTTAYDASVPAYEQPSAAYDPSAPAHETAAVESSAPAYQSAPAAYQPPAPAIHEPPASTKYAPAAATAVPPPPAAAAPLSPAAQRPSVAPAASAKSVSVSLSGRPTEPKSGDDVLLPPQAVPPGREPVAPAERQEMARVDAELLDQLLNISGEASIARSRLEQQLGSIDFNLGELSRTVTRLKEQLRNLEIETEAQILHRHEDESSHRGDFDPLELDRYSSIQQFSRALAETANDVGSIQQLLENLGKETQNLLQQQARTITELQNGLMRTRMVPFQRHVQRLARIVRQAANDTGKKADLVVEGASGELDRQVLERMLPPFEHMLRNAVVHGIEKPRDRIVAGKPEAGRIVLELHREGAEVMVRLIDDGGGMNLKAIRDKGAALGLIPPGQTLSDEDAMQLILEPGFSTAGTITQQAGRGVGMDVVATEIKRLGGALHMETKPGQGTVFTIRLPFTLAISHALVVRTGDEFYALPLPTVEGVLRLSKAEVLAHLGKDASAFDYGGQKYRFQHLATFVALEPSPLPEQDVTIPVVLVRAGEHSTGLVADELVGSREIVVKSVGPQISSIRGISGATILGDGRIVIILDIGALVRAEWRGRAQPPPPVAPKEKSDKRTFAMVVDDSITVRRVTQRLLERNGMRVLTARDGMDAVTLLQDNIPDVILLDIEMPRMDGYEVAAHVRNDPRLKDVPIIMITSRVGEKHRARAIELGVDDYLGKPYQEAQLLDAIAPLVERHRSTQGSGTYERLSDARA